MKSELENKLGVIMARARNFQDEFSRIPGKFEPLMRDLVTFQRDLKAYNPVIEINIERTDVYEVRGLGGDRTAFIFPMLLMVTCLLVSVNVLGWLHYFGRL